MRYYLIPGLGADERVFRNLRFPPRSEITCLGWITPHLGESLRAYALRMSARIDKEEEFTLVGLSLGGMIAVEIANHRPVRRVILISSVPLSAHLPRYFRLIARSRLHQFLPVSILKNASRLKRLFTRETSEDKAMLRVMISDCSNEFIRWAMHAVLSWENNTLPPGLYHIHGSRDGILPGRYTSPTHTIRGGGHMMVLTRAQEISAIIAGIGG